MTNEPTTGEIVRALRSAAEKSGARKPICDETIAADRLEKQEQTIATMRGDSFDATSVTNVLAYLDTVIGLIHCADGIKDLIVSMQGTAIELTARAEQAELARDILCGTIRDIEEPKTVGSSTFTIERRGLPQEGEKV